MNASITHHIHVDLNQVKACADVMIDPTTGDYVVTEVEVMGIVFHSGDIFDAVAAAVLVDDRLRAEFAEAA